MVSFAKISQDRLLFKILETSKDMESHSGSTHLSGGIRLQIRNDIINSRKERLLRATKGFVDTESYFWLEFVFSFFSET